MAKFQVLYTKHKTQTRKTWQDGFIKFNAFNRKVTLTSEDENEVLDSLFLKQTFQLRDGSIFETEKFLVDVQEVDGLLAAMNGAPVKPPPAVPKVPAIISNTTHHTAVKRKAPDALPTNEPKKRRLGLNRAVIRAGTVAGASEFKQPSVRSLASSASVPSDSAETVSAYEEYSSAPPMQEKMEVQVPRSTAVPRTEPSVSHSPAVVDHYTTDEHDGMPVMQSEPEEIEYTTRVDVPAQSDQDIASPEARNENSFDLSLSPSSPDIDFGFLIEPLTSNTNVKQPHSPLSNCNNNNAKQPHSPFSNGSNTNVKQPYSPPSDDNTVLNLSAPSLLRPTQQLLFSTNNTNVKSTSLLNRRVGLSKASDGIIAAPKVSPASVASDNRSPLNKSPLPQPEFKSPKQSLSSAKANRWTHSSLCFPDKQTCEELEKSMPKPRRSILIPNNFTDIKHYVTVFTESMHEELNLQLLELAQRFHKQSSSLLGNKGFMSHDAEKKLRGKGVKVYANCTLAKSAITPFKQKEAKDKATQLYLTLDKTSREHYSHYAKDDIWILSSSSTFAPRNADDIFFLARSVYHGPNSNGLLEIKPVGEMPRIGNKQLLHAIHGPNFSLDMTMLDHLSRLPESTLPLIPSLLGQFQPSPRLRVNLPQSRIVELAQQTITDHRLNEDQQRVIMNCVQWFDGAHVQLKDDVVLVHGVYGSGKSHLLVVLIIFLCTMLKEANNEDIRILISAATNTAVDRILLGLLELDFTEFIRVGSLKRIAKPVLPFTLHRDRGDSKADNDRSDKLAQKELQEMLQGSGLSSKERSYIKQAIEDIKNGRVKQRIDKLKKVRVVGVTCAASVFPVLEGNKFQIVILDESSQMLEPLSMLPIGKFGCEKLISVGDPMQLPPTLTSNQITTSQDDHTLGKTLFTRLAHLGVIPIMLRTQYRLHPQLSKISNKLFYNNQLRDGVTSDDRAPLANDVPTLLFCNTANSGKEVTLGESHFNLYEAQLVIELILMLLERGCRGEQIGVIALYKRQEQKINELLLQRSGMVPVNQQPSQETEDDAPSRESALSQVQISTVDAFQGAEKEVIIVSTVRTGKLGFTDSPNRLNVALTRARRHLLIVGRANTLTLSHLWREVIAQARATPRGFQQAQQLLAHKSFMSPNIAALPEEPASDTCQSEGDNDAPPPEIEAEEDNELEEMRSELRGSRDSPEPLPGPELEGLSDDISLLGNSNLDELPNDEVHEEIDDGQIMFALDDEAVVSPSPSRSVAQSSEFTADVALEEFDDHDEFDLGF